MGSQIAHMRRARGWDETRDLFRAIGMGEYVVDMEAVTSGRLADVVDRLRRGLGVFRRSCIPKIIEMCLKARASGSLLREAYLASSGQGGGDQGSVSG